MVPLTAQQTQIFIDKYPASEATYTLPALHAGEWTNGKTVKVKSETTVTRSEENLLLEEIYFQQFHCIIFINCLNLFCNLYIIVR